MPHAPASERILVNPWGGEYSALRDRIHRFVSDLRDECGVNLVVCFDGCKPAGKVRRQHDTLLSYLLFFLMAFFFLSLSLPRIRLLRV